VNGLTSVTAILIHKKEEPQMRPSVMNLSQFLRDNVMPFQL